MPKKHYLGIDVGGTYIKFAVLNSNFKLVSFWQLTTPQQKPALLRLIVDQVLLKQKMFGKFAGLGIALPGLVDAEQGLVVKASKINITNLPLAKIVSQKLKLPVKLDNDANCYTLAESLLGAGKKFQLVVGLTLGTGLGGGLVINKKIFHGRRFAGELGHQIIDYKNNLTWESFVGSKYLKMGKVDYLKIAAATKKKDNTALVFWNKLGCLLGYGCVNICHSLDPEIIILGGKLTYYFSLFYPSLKKVVTQHCIFKVPPIRRGQLIDRGGAIGAALLFKQE